MSMICTSMADTRKLPGTGRFDCNTSQSENQMIRPISSALTLEWTAGISCSIAIKQFCCWMIRYVIKINSKLGWSTPHSGFMLLMTKIFARLQSSCGPKVCFIDCSNHASGYTHMFIHPGDLHPRVPHR